MRVFFDANVLVSICISPQGGAFKAFSFVSAGHDFVLGAYVLEEALDKLRNKFNFDEPLVQFYENTFREGASYIEPIPERLVDKKLRDPKDEPVLTSAIRSKSDYLVTSDRDLLDVAGDIEEVKIISLAAFLKAFVD